MSVMRHASSRDKMRDARQLLGAVYASFTEGFDTKDSQDAKALLNAGSLT